MLKLQKEFNAKNNGQIYITGTPVHSNITSQKSSFEINLICIISTIALILLCKFYFKSFKILVPIASSIAFGMFFGWIAVQAIAGSVHILSKLDVDSSNLSGHFCLHRHLKIFSKDQRQNCINFRTICVFFDFRTL